MARFIPRLLRCLALAAVLAGGDAAADQALRIAAIVNDEIISAYDLDARLQLIIGSSSLPRTPEVRARLAPEALRSLIDDRLRLQEAKRSGVIVSEDELARAFKNLEHNNGMPPGTLDRFLESQGIDKAALAFQMEAELAWSKLLRTRVASRITIGDDEIKAGITRLAAARNKPHYKVAEIFLPIDGPADEEEAKTKANRLIQELRQGASFPALARNFSKGSTAVDGGGLGWVSEGELPAELDKVIRGMSPGELAPPIRSLSGIHLLFLQDKRVGAPPKEEVARPAAAPAAPVDTSGTVEISQLVLPLAPDAKPADVKAAAEKAKGMAAPAKNCRELDAIGRKASPLSGNLTVKVVDLPRDLQQIVGGLKINQMAPPRRTVDGIAVLMLCDRKGGTPAPAPTPPPAPAPPQPEKAKDEPPSHDAVRAQLMNERLAVQSRRYLRDLRRAAVVDIRQ